MSQKWGFSNPKPRICQPMATKMRHVSSSLTESKWSSKCTWNWGLTSPVGRFRTKCTDLPCLCDGPRFTPMRALSLHLCLCRLEPRCSSESSTQAGQPKVWKCVKLVATSNCKKWCIEMHPVWLQDTLRCQS